MTTIKFIKECLGEKEFKRFQFMKEELKNEELEIIDEYRKYLKKHVIVSLNYKYNNMTFNQFRFKYLCGMADMDDIIVYKQEKINQIECELCHISLDTEIEYFIKCLHCDIKFHKVCLKDFHKEEKDDDEDRYCPHCTKKHRKYKRDFIYEKVYIKEKEEKCMFF